MIRKVLLPLIFILGSFTLTAQTIRTDVIVIGGTTAGVSAAIQAARSGVKSLIVGEGTSLNPKFGTEDLRTLERIRDHYIYNHVAEGGKLDTSARQPINFGNAALILKSITDTVKNLTVMLNSGLRDIDKEGKGWEVKLLNGRTVKADVVIDATVKHSVSAMLKIDPLKTIIQTAIWLKSPILAPKLFRSSVGWGTKDDNNTNVTYLMPVATLMPAGTENIFVISPASDDLQPQAMLAGQAAGASAAFCAFFKTTSKNLNIRLIQGEMLAYDARIIPYDDVAFNDRHALALQHTGLSGILKWKTALKDSNEVFVFDTLGTITSEELRLPMKEYYSRSQIWFADHKKDSLTIEDAISLLMFTATRGEELRREIGDGWKNSFKFSSAYEPKRAINRREFAVLTNRYLQPFNIRIDLNGRLLN